MNIRSSLPRFSFTPDEAAESTGFSRTRIFQAIRAGEITARKDGKATVIETDELLRWLRSLPTRGRRPSASNARASAGNRATETTPTTEVPPAAATI